VSAPFAALIHFYSDEGDFSAPFAVLMHFFQSGRVFIAAFTCFDALLLSFWRFSGPFEALRLHALSHLML
jgi:hypothetical protein